MFGAMMGVDRIPVFAWLNAATGWHMTPAEYMTVGKRIQTLRQLFNVRQGVDAHALFISPRAAGQPPLLRGANRKRSVPVAALARGYWQAMGWDADTGAPLPATLAALGVDDLAAGTVLPLRED
jgi:aldehyde:ferredoxin oxidoreductase